MESKPKGLFDHITHIYAEQNPNYFETLTDAEKKAYSVYMVNRFLSMNPHQLPFVHEIQQYTVPPEIHYSFFRSILPKRRQFNKYIKSKKEDKYEAWLVDLVVKHFSISVREAIDYLEIYYIHNKLALRQLCEKYGVEQKLIKKEKI